MLLIGLIIACVVTIGVDGGTCKECKTAYGSAAKDDDTKKCTALKDHIKCLEDATGEECPLDTAAIKVITDGKAAIADGKCDLTGGCKCQYDFYVTQLKDATPHCTALKKRVSCLTLEEAVGCDGTKTVIALATATKTKATAASCTIDKSCECELAYAKADIGDKPKKCTAASKFIGCVKGFDGTGRCDTAGDKLTDMVKTTAKVITDDDTCKPTAVCNCEITFSKTDITATSEICSSSKAYTKCLDAITDATKGCDGASNTTVLKTDHEQLKLCTDSSMKPLMASLAVIFISAFVTLI